MPLFLFLRTLVIHILLLSTSTMLFAGGIKGTVKADDGTPLAFATIFVKQTGSGAVTGLEGQYEVTLLPGNYDITFQYLGYEAVTRSVTIAEDFIELNLTLKSQAIV
ncbi:MAG: carboxypeptidase-like regulatory domain-containing protein, partial [Cyclobacteriaceae bacterium]